MSLGNEIVTLVNRTKNTICEGVWDGKTHAIPPGKFAFTRTQAEKFKEQNAVMGSGDPRTAHGIFKQREYLLGILEDGDDCSPIEQSNSIEAWDRDKVAGGTKAIQVIPGKTGIYSGSDVAENIGNSDFVKP